MDSNKKQQASYERSLNTKPSLPAESNRKSSDQQVNRQRNSRRREQISTPRNEQPQRGSKQQAQQLRTNVEKRPRARRGGNAYNANNSSVPNDVSSCSSDDFAPGSSGLAGARGGSGGGAAANRHGPYNDVMLNSVYAPGSKKQNLSHLLNFHYTPRDGDYPLLGRAIGGGNVRHYRSDHHNTSSSGGGGGGVGNGGLRRHHYFNKEQFLQANFQFVIRGSARPLMTASPDTLIDWNAIEQINIHTTEEPQCPICLYPPVAAKLTRCGHVYCWPCLLHYLSLSDKPWRKCPICYDAIHAADLKSCTIMQQQAINVGDRITFQLMRRRKASMFIERFKPHSDDGIERFPLVSAADDVKRYSKFLIARRHDIGEIIERECRELLLDNDSTCPEYVFIQEALIMLNERREKLGVLDMKEDEADATIMESDNQNLQQSSAEVSEIDEKLNVLETSKQSDATEESDVLPPTNFEASASDENEGAGIVKKASLLARAAYAAAEEVTESTAGSTNYNKYYYFYQSDDGQNIYLHPLNVKMLQACYGSLERAPLVIEACLLQSEHHSMDEDHRRKFTCLGHLPLTCQFAVVEVDLQPPTVNIDTLKAFKGLLQTRKQERQRREREERKREKHINEINDRQMGKLIATTTNLNLGSAYEFPTCGFEESLPPLGSSPRHSKAVAANQQAAASYSAIASPKQEFWPTVGSAASSTASGSSIGPLAFKNTSTGGAWGRATPPPPPPPIGASPTHNRGSDCDLRPMTTSLSDVLAKAMSQKQPNNAGSGKKQKKSKKMTPIFATGMNYSGN